MKVKLKSLGVKVKSPAPMPVESAKTASETVERFPDVQLTSKQISDIENCKVGQKYHLMFEAEVKGDRSPDEWRQREDGLKPTDRIVDFKLTKGNAGLVGKMKGHKNLNEASMAARKETY